MNLRFLTVLLLLLVTHAARAGEVPRVILAIHDAKVTAAASENYAYSLAEMPLNHLGLKLEFANARKAVPAIAKRADLRGVLVWLNDGRGLPLQALTRLLREANARGIPVVFFGNLPNGLDDRGRPVTLDAQNAFLATVGMRSAGGYVPYTYNLSPVVRDTAMVEFERKLPSPPPAADSVTPLSPGARTLLAYARRGDDDARTHPVVLTPQGGYVAAGYTHYEDRSGTLLQWYINPFRFFAEAFRTRGLPVPDTTTAAGRRIYYSHIDGDGWGSVSTADRYAGRGIHAAEVIYHEVARAFPDLPVTVAPIAADIDPAWAGTLRTEQIARAFFRLANVEPATHTYTHPFEWSYFGAGYKPEDELAYVKRYPKVKIAPGLKAPAVSSHKKLLFPYDAPRAYGDIPFSLYREIQGSAAFINSLCPPGKRVRLVQWSGDTSPFEGAVAAAFRAGLYNLNGRDTRLDGDAPSYAAVSPVGVLSGRQMQVSASHANENVYTDLWQGRFFGFRYLKVSLDNTERPIRVKPINIYYHMYSGEKQASLAALLEVINHAARQEITPITATRFAAIGQGFFSVRLVGTGPNTWRVENRGALDTIRFDNPGAMDIDAGASSGVLGSRRMGDVLYVALDPASPVAVIAMRAGPVPPAGRPLLVQSRWLVRNLTASGDAVSFDASGFGPGEMAWRVPQPVAGETWEVTTSRGTAARGTTDSSGVVQFTLPRGAEAGLRVSMRRGALRPVQP